MDNLKFVYPPRLNGMSEEKLNNSLLQKLHSETALIGWRDLQRFFAQGRVLRVENGINLVEIAVSFANDQTRDIQPLLEREKIARPDDDLARRWYENDVELWSVVVAPFVLVQEQS